jgi:hypothetical protein
MRADQLLVERGLAASRSQAQRLIATGVQWRNPLHTGSALKKTVSCCRLIVNCNCWMTPSRGLCRAAV